MKQGFIQYRGTLIGLGGKLRAGKDAVGDYLEEHHGYVKLGMSDVLNAALQKVGPEGPWIHLDFDVAYLGLTGGFVRYTDLLATVGYVEAKKHIDVREYLQGLGTEVGRDMIDPDVWVNIMAKKIQDLLIRGENVVITAIRFPNELSMVNRLGGTSVWIERPDEARGGVEALAGHASETSVTGGMFSRVIQNDSDLETLYGRVEELLAQIPRPRTGTYYDGDGRAVGGIIEGSASWPAYDR